MLRVDEIIFAYAQGAMKSFPRMLSKRWNCFLVCSAWDVHVKIVNILPPAEHAWKFVWRRLSWNCFLVCSVCDKIVSTYAQHSHANKKNTQKYQNKMQISTIINQNFEKPKWPTGPTWTFKNKFLISRQKIWFQVCSVTAEMFERRNSGKKRRKRIKKIF